MKELFLRAARWQHIWLVLIVVASLAVHFAIILHPPELVFDEIYYVEDARSVINGGGDLRPEHPPLAKALVLTNIILFGDNPIGWRLFPVLFGTASIILFYFICRSLGMSMLATNFATFLLTWENLTFIQSSVAMLDVFSVTFMMAAFLVYLRGSYPAAGLLVGLSALAKFSGVLALPVIGLHWIIARRDRWRPFATLLVLAPISFLILMSIFNLALDGQVREPISLVTNMLGLNASQTFANTSHPAMSRPWEWLIFFQNVPYWNEPRYVALITPTVWALIIPAMAFSFYIAIKHNAAGLFAFIWFMATYLLWVVIILFTNRISFLFYLYPAIGGVCLGLGLGLDKIISFTRSIGNTAGKIGRLSVSAFLISHFVTFVALSPLISSYWKW